MGVCVRRWGWGRFPLLHITKLLLSSHKLAWNGVYYTTHCFNYVLNEDWNWDDENSFVIFQLLIECFWGNEWILCFRLRANLPSDSVNPFHTLILHGSSSTGLRNEMKGIFGFKNPLSPPPLAHSSSLWFNSLCMIYALGFIFISPSIEYNHAWLNCYLLYVRFSRSITTPNLPEQYLSVKLWSVNEPQKIRINQNIIDTLQITWESTGRTGIGIRGTLAYSSPITFIHIYQKGTGIYYRIWGTFTSRNCLYVLGKDIIIYSFFTLPVCVLPFLSVQSRGWGQVLVYTPKGFRGCGDTWQRHCCYTQRGGWFR